MLPVTWNVTMIATEKNRNSGSLCGFHYSNPLLVPLYLQQATGPKTFYIQDRQVLFNLAYKRHRNNN